MSFNDDEKIDMGALQDSGSKPTPIIAGRVQLISINNNMVPLEENKLTVMLEITGGYSSNERCGLDLVAVLDVSGSMAGEKLEKAKTAMLFVLKKLSPIDRLSIVTFATEAQRLCPLRQITKNSQKEIENIINGLIPTDATNITAGLQTALKVINDRSVKAERTVGIMLMSDGEQNRGGDAAQVPLGNVPVHTFGFGTNHEPTVLTAIAHNAIGGTFAEVHDMDNLSKAFSQCLGGLLTQVVDDLQLTVTEVFKESTIQQVTAGSYPQSKDDAAASVTVTFGGLYAKEVRKVMVDLLLPSVPKERGADVLEINYLYRFHDKPFEATPVTLAVKRSGKIVDQQERPEVKNEQTRLFTASMIKEARVMADNKNLDDARDMLVKAQNALEDVEDNPLIEMLRSELLQLLKLMKTQDIYDKQGRPFALSSEISHARQRFAARGDGESLRMFSTPRMDKYLEQAKSFDEDPSKPLPTADEDVKEEIAANPLAPIAGALSFYIQSAIQSLQAIEKILIRGV